MILPGVDRMNFAHDVLKMGPVLCRAGWLGHDQLHGHQLHHPCRRGADGGLVPHLYPGGGHGPSTGPGEGWLLRESVAACSMQRFAALQHHGVWGNACSGLEAGNNQACWHAMICPAVNWRQRDSVPPTAAL